MEAVLVLFLLAVTGTVSHAIGRRRGSRENPQAAQIRQSDTAAYQAGYLAGHLAGWRDAEAKRREPQGPGAQAVPLPPSPQPSFGNIQPPLRLPAPWPAQASSPVAPANHVQHQPSFAPVERPRVPVQERPASFQQHPAAAQQHPAAAQQRPAMLQQPGGIVQQPTAPPETPEQRAARKEKRDQQNINITLYVASLLLVAAGALFVGTSLPELLRFVGIWIITALFYVAGLVIHARVPRLRPAAIAFVGTGLALIPVTGLAMYNFVLHDGPAAWLVTSLLGTLLYVFTALRLDNKVLAFLSLSFAVSTALSGVSVLGGALVWYFTALIGVAILLTVAALLRPGWLPPLYVRPVMTLHPFVVPAVAVAVTLAPNLLSKGEYPLVMAMCGAYFAVMVFVPGVRYRLLHFYAARIALTLAILGVAWDVSTDVKTVMLAGIICLGVQAFGMALMGKKITPLAWWNDAVSCLGLQLVVSVVLTLLIGVTRSDLPVYVPLYITMFTAMVSGWKLSQGSEFAPAGVVALSLPFTGLLGAWPISVLLGSAGLYWFVLATVQRGPRRQQLILAGRAAMTLTAPMVVAAGFADSPDRIAFALLALIAAAALQHVITAVLERSQLRLLAPQATLAGFGGVAMAGLLVLPGFDHALGRPVTTAAVLVVAGAGLASGLLVFPRAGGQAGSATPWQPTLGELLAPATLLAAGGVAGVAVSGTLGNTVLLLAVAYTSVTALRVTASFHRQCYWWLVRAEGTFLVASVFLDARRHGWSFEVAGEVPTLALVVLFAAGIQVVLPLRAGSRRAFPRASTVDAGVVVGVMASMATFLTVTSALGVPAVRDGWQPGAAAATTAVAAVVSGAVLRSRPTAWVFAPAALIILLALRIGNARDVEILLGVFAAYSGFMVAVVRDRVSRGVYLLGLRVLTASLVAVVVADVTDSPTAVSVTLALLLAAQHAVTLVLRRGIDVAFQRATTWTVLTAQLLLPAAYLLGGNDDGGGRWVVILELALGAASAWIAWRFLGGKGAEYCGVAAVIAGILSTGPGLRFPVSTWLHQPLLDETQVLLLLLGAAVAIVIARSLLHRRVTGAGSGTATDRWFWLISALAFVGTSGLLSLDVSHSLTGLSVLVLAAVLFAASHLENIPALYAGAAAAVVVGAIPAVEGLLEGLPAGVWSDYAVWLVGGVGSAVALYVVKVFAGASIKGEPWRRNSLVTAVVAALACSAAVGLVHDETAVVGFALVLATGVIVVFEVPYGKWPAGEIAGLISVAALQRTVLLTDGARPDWFWALQWYVVAGAVLAGLRYVRQQRADGLLRLFVTAGALSVSSLGTIVGGSAAQQLYVMVGHVLLLVTGLLLAERALVWWGAAGVALCVMWALRSYAFAMLALVAVALIVLAVWRLNRKPPAGTKPPVPQGDSGDAMPARHQDGIR